jgi:putative lipase involved disintegration of autophagic bodies
MSISSHAAATSAYLKRSSHDLFVAMTTIVLEMISSFKMSNATIVYNEFKDFSKHIDDGATFKEDAWLRSAFIFGEIMSKVIILSMKSMSNDLYMKIRVRLELNLLHRLYLRTQVGEMNDADVFLNEPYRHMVGKMPTQ